MADALSGTGALTIPAVQRSQIAEETGIYPIPWNDCRTWDAWQTILPGTAANDDAAIITGTLGSSEGPTIQGKDSKAANETQYFGFEFVLPPEYKDGQSVVCRIRAGMVTTASDGTATVDLEAYKQDGDGAVGSDICATSAQDINSLTKSTNDFTITATGLVSGDRLLCRVALVVSDAATGTAVIAEVSNVTMRIEVQG